MDGISLFTFTFFDWSSGDVGESGGETPLPALLCFSTHALVVIKSDHIKRNSIIAHWFLCTDTEKEIMPNKTN